MFSLENLLSKGLKYSTELVYYLQDADHEARIALLENPDFIHKYPGIAIFLLEQDDSIYCDWATQLGCIIPQKTNKSPRDVADAWFSKESSKALKQTKNLIPNLGPAKTIQGEIQRSLNIISSETIKNGMMNWEENPGYYEKTTNFIQEALLTNADFSPLIQNILYADIAVLNNKGLGKGRKSKEMAEDGYIDTLNTESIISRLHNIASIWTNQQENPIPNPIFDGLPVHLFEKSSGDTVKFFRYQVLGALVYIEQGAGGKSKTTLRVKNLGHVNHVPKGLNKIDTQKIKQGYVEKRLKCAE